VQLSDSWSHTVTRLEIQNSTCRSVQHSETEITFKTNLPLIPFGTYLPCCKAPPASTSAVLKSATWQKQNHIVYVLIVSTVIMPHNCCALHSCSLLCSRRKNQTPHAMRQCHWSHVKEMYGPSGAKWAHRVALVISATLSQTQAYAARPRPVHHMVCPFMLQVFWYSRCLLMARLS